MLYLSVVFISAFLLFQVQPIMAKLILPLFGGGAAVWTSCLLFFQTFLLIGYLYAHALTKLRIMRAQVMVHGILLLGSLLVLPVGMSGRDGQISSSSPLLDIIMLLATTVGLPYLLLSSTGPLVQRWLTYAEQGKLPYRLYSLSNIGSLLALTTYPFLIEPSFAMDSQTLIWSIGYALFVAAYGALGVVMLKLPKDVVAKSQVNDDTSVAGYKIDSLLWILLSAVGVILLVSTTNAMTQNIPPMPFLWILPLCIYLLSFIIAFNGARWYVRWYWLVLFTISSFAAVLMFFIGSQFDILSMIGMYSLILLSACMICHGELARIKPPAQKLTLFYLYISLGGALGSLFVSFVATELFVQFLEFPIAIFAVFVLFMVCLKRYPAKSETRPMTQLFGLTQQAILKGASAISLLLVFLMFYTLNGLYDQYNVDSSRNFYGILAVKDVEVNGKRERRLIDGTTSHGTQSLEANEAMVPLSYYRANTGGALVLQNLSPAKPMNVGFIGLGAGALAAYGRKGDNYHFYELNPDVEAMAREHFSFLGQSKANVSVTLGDGRINLAHAMKEGGSKQFQALVVDAFSGDSIPNHLLTTEAFELYWQHLADDGVLAIHISNTHLELTPLVRGLAEQSNTRALYFKHQAAQDESHSAQWVLISNNERFMDNPIVKKFVTQWPLSADKNLVWTDNYSNLLSVLKL
jgi:spermidine synthase